MCVSTCGFDGVSVFSVLMCVCKTVMPVDWKIFGILYGGRKHPTLPFSDYFGGNFSVILALGANNVHN